MPYTVVATSDPAHSLSTNRTAQCCQVCKLCREFENRALATCTPPKNDNFGDQQANSATQLRSDQDCGALKSPAPPEPGTQLTNSTIPRGLTPSDVVDSSERGGGSNPNFRKIQGGSSDSGRTQAEPNNRRRRDLGRKRRQAGGLVNEVDNRRGSTP